MQFIFDNYTVVLEIMTTKFPSVYYHTIYDIECICYDDACHLKKYSMNKIRCSITDQSKFLCDIPMAVDRLHFSGHVDQWCLDNCNPDDLDILKEVISPQP